MKAGYLAQKYKAGEPSPDGVWWNTFLTNEKMGAVPQIDRSIPYKVSHNLKEFKRDEPISVTQKEWIRRFLYLPMRGPMRLCKAKNKNFVLRREKVGDYSHSSNNHICKDCRCQRIAGQGTKGDFYGIGENTGHWGVGWCQAHEMNRRTTDCLAMAAHDLWTTRYVGDHIMDMKGYEDNVSLEARNASIRLEVREELQVVADALHELKEKLQTPQEEQMVEALEKLSDAVKQSEFVDIEQAENIRALLGSKVLERTELTEYQKGVLVPLSSKSQIELKLTAAKTLSTLKLNEFKLDSASYVHYDELAKRYAEHLRIIRQGLNQLREQLAKHKEGDPDPVQRIYDWITHEHARIWDSVKTGAKR
jgi:hypothetical protein